MPQGILVGRGATIVFFRAPIPWGATKVVFYKNKIRSLLCILKAFKRLLRVLRALLVPLEVL